MLKPLTPFVYPDFTQELGLRGVWFRLAAILKDAKRSPSSVGLMPSRLSHTTARSPSGGKVQLRQIPTKVPVLAVTKQ